MILRTVGSVAASFKQGKTNEIDSPVLLPPGEGVINTIMNRLYSWLKYWLHFLFWQHGGLVIVLLMSLFIRLRLFAWWNTFPYGDVFNFINIARDLGQGHYPPLEKRLPFYPFLILVGYLLLPGVAWETIAIWIAIIASLLCLVFLYAIGRYFGFSKTALVVGLLLFTSFQPFLHFSIRGYADTTTIALLLAAVLAALYSDRPKVALSLPFLLAALSLTRYEGLVATAALSLVVAFRLRHHWRRLLLLGGLLVLLMLPYVVVMKRSERSLLPQAYLQQAAIDGPDGYGAFSFSDWREKYMGIWQRLGLFSFWYMPRNLYQTVRDDPLGLPYQVTELITEPRAVIGLLATIGWLFLLLRRKLIDVLTVAVPFLVAAIPVAWWAPYTRYDSLMMPVMIVAAMAALHVMVVILRRATADGEHWGRWLRFGAVSCLLLVACSIWLLRATQEATDMLKKTQFFSLAYYQALQHAQSLSGNIAFTQDDNMNKIYFSSRAVYAKALLKDKPEPPVAWQRLNEAKVQYVVNRVSENSLYSFLETEPYKDRVRTIAEYEVTQGDGEVDRAVIYQMP